MTKKEKRHLKRIAALGGQVALATGQAKALGKKYGKINGRKIAKSGQLAKAASLGGRAAVKTGHLLSVCHWGAHIKWHVNRGTEAKPGNCIFCDAERRARIVLNK